jgi:hypothetical protein
MQINLPIYNRETICAGKQITLPIHDRETSGQACKLSSHISQVPMRTMAILSLGVRFRVIIRVRVMFRVR